MELQSLLNQSEVARRELEIQVIPAVLCVYMCMYIELCVCTSSHVQDTCARAQEGHARLHRATGKSLLQEMRVLMPGPRSGSAHVCVSADDGAVTPV